MVNAKGDTECDTVEEMELTAQGTESTEVDFAGMYRYLIGRIHDLDQDYLSQLKSLRAHLSCSVCTKIADQPYSVSGCGHLSCKGCVGCEKQPEKVRSCSNYSCNDWKKHEFDAIMLCYVSMFKDLCKLICTTSAMRKYMKGSPSRSLWMVVKEGALSDIMESNLSTKNEICRDSELSSTSDSDEKSGSSSCDRHPVKLPLHGCTARSDLDVLTYEERLANGVEVELMADADHGSDHGKKKRPSKCLGNSSLAINVPATNLNSRKTSVMPGATKFLISAIPQVARDKSQEAALLRNANIVSKVIIPCAPSVQKTSAQLMKSKARNGCRCGIASTSPGKLTCCGQRCPCFTDSKGCTTCKCRGCRNPYLPAAKSAMTGLRAVLGLPSTSQLRVKTARIEPSLKRLNDKICDQYCREKVLTKVYPSKVPPTFARFSLPLPLLAVSDGTIQVEGELMSD